MVVLDAVLEIQRTPGPGPGRPLELQGGQVRLVRRRGERPAALMCKTRLDDLPEDEPITRRAAEGVPGHPRPRQRRLLELRGEQADPAVHAEARRRVVDRAGGRRPDERVPQVHRVLPLPGRVPRPARPPACTPATSGRASWSGSRASRCIRWTRSTGPTSWRTRAASASATSRSAAREVCPEGIHITDNAIIPLKERVVDRRYDPLFKLARRIAARRASAEGVA